MVTPLFVTQRAYVLSPNVGPADIEDVQDDLKDPLKPKKLEDVAPKMILWELDEWTSTAYPRINGSSFPGIIIRQ